MIFMVAQVFVPPTPNSLSQSRNVSLSSDVARTHVKMRNFSMNLLPILLLISVVSASPGDKLKRFKRCVRECDSVVCHQSNYPTEWSFPPFDARLRFLLWTCKQDCDYQCQQIITQERKAKNRNTVQFHGKWPFKRVWGIQESVSMVFSMGNFIPHYAGQKKLMRWLNGCKTYETKVQLWTVLVSSIITCFAWLFSTIFHTRDFLVTERLDYYFAGLTVLSGLFTVCVRFFELYHKHRVNQLVTVVILFVTAYTAHVYRLVVDWSYTYNMQANVSVGIAQNVLMSLLCYRLYSQYYHQESPSMSHKQYSGPMLLQSFFSASDKLYSLYPLILGIIVIFGMSLEIFDFAPILGDLVDAHSLWHLVTIIPVVYGWYDWLIWDSVENVGKNKTD